MESELSAQVIGDWKTCFEKAFDRRRVDKHTSEQWYALRAVRPSCGESSSQYDVRFSTVVEERQVDYVPVLAPSRKVAGPGPHHSSPGKEKKKVSGSPVKLPRHFELSSPSASPPKPVVIEEPSFASASASQSQPGKTRKRGRDRKAAPVFQRGMP